jgi:adenylate kinase
MRLIFSGPQGVGKGTQAKIIAHYFAIAHISTGDLFREYMTKDTPLARKIQTIINRGEFVNDEITNDVVRQRLTEADAQPGFILDGYPRNVGQVRFLDEYLASIRGQIDRVFSLVASKEHLIQRINKRAQEEGRSDDTETAIVKRLEEFERQTKPVIDVYAQRNLVSTVNASGNVDDISKTLVALIKTQVLSGR